MLVTGGAGFIGSHFIEYLLGSDPEVFIVNLDKLTYAGSVANLSHLPDPSRHHFIQGDIINAELVSDILNKYQIDTLVHFAAESHVDRSIQNPDAFIQTNVNGTFTLLEATRRYWLAEKLLSPKRCRFHHISTDEVFGSLGPADPGFSESSPYQPNSPYSASKAASDHLVRAYFHTYGLPVTLSNCSNNFGPNQHDEKLIPTIIRACLNQKPIPIYGNGSNVRDWLYVEDHCRAVDLVLRKGKPGRAYNIGTHNEWSNLALANYLADCMDILCPEYEPHSRLIEYVRDRPGHDWRYAIDSRRIHSELGWAPVYQFEEAIQKTIEAIRRRCANPLPQTQNI